MDLSGFRETISTRGKILPARSRMVGSVNGKSIIVPRIRVLGQGRSLAHPTIKQDQPSAADERAPREINVKVDIRNAFFGDSKLFLIPYRVSSWAFTATDSRCYAPEPSMSRKVVVTSDQLETRPDVVAYE